MFVMESTVQKSLSKPKVLNWYYAFCGLSSLMWLGILLDGIWELCFPTLHEEWADKVFGKIFIFIGLLFIPYAVAPFLPHKPWVWIYGLVLIGFVMLNTCCLPIAVPIVIFWLDPKTRQYFRRGNPPDLPASEKSI